MTTEENKAIASRWAEEVYQNKRRLLCVIKTSFIFCY
jgi:hypothetical protein